MQAFFRQSRVPITVHSSYREAFFFSLAMILIGCGGGPSNTIQYTYHPNGSVQTEYTYQNGDREGPFREFDERGRIVFVGKITEGVVKGMRRAYYAEGALKSDEEYIDGLRWGQSRLFFPNGRIQQESFYEQGKLEGLVKDYSPNGSLERERFYKDNQLHGLFREYGGNVLRMERYYQNGYLHGESVEFAPDGTLRKEEVYSNGNLDGVSKKYGRDGKVEVERTYEKGDLRVERTFYPKGWVMREVFFRQGKTIEIKKYFEGERLMGEQKFAEDLPTEEIEYSEYGQPVVRRIFEEGVLKKTLYYDATGKEQPPGSL